jgi:2',3'-cyclic-nucleotide 2'-phosphodiesterase/3'-nucleotidase
VRRFPRRRFLVGLGLALCAALALAAGPRRGPEQVTLTLLATTDLHGNLVPHDYYANRPAPRGLAKIATLVRQVRDEQPNLLLLDCGDTIQGTPLAYYFARKDTSKPNPTIAAMNALGYDAMALGNHEFNFGLDVLWKAKREARFPILAANVRQTYAGGVERFLPYIIKEVAGVRVGIVGFVTPGVPYWEVPEHYRGYEFERIADAARRVIPEVRPQVDLLVVIAHSGLGRELETGAPQTDRLPGEDAMWDLAEQVPGIDLILFGHSHRELPEKFVNGVLLAQARNWGQSLARADVVMERDAQGRWRVAAKRSTVLPVTESVATDADILKLARPYHDATQTYLDSPVATSRAALDGSTARYEDHPLVDLIHKVQMENAKADVSMATMFYPGVQIPAGPVTVRQLAAVYIYENTLYAVEMTGPQLREALEHAASYFPAWPAPEGPVRLPGYNADCAEGVEYVVDLRQPVGQRIRDLRYRGAALDPAQKLRVAINNYRYSGGGKYAVYAKLPIVYRSPVEVRELLIEHVARTGAIPAAANRNWRLEPREAFEALVREARARESRLAASAAAPR